MRYVDSRRNLYGRENAYRIYVTDALRAAYHLNIRYEDMFKKADTRSPEDIINHITSKLVG